MSSPPAIALFPEPAPELDRTPDRNDWVQRRQYERYPTNWPACCEAYGAGSWAVTIINASEGGFGLSRDLPVDIGAELTIKITDIGEFKCALAWKGKDECGVRLLRGRETFSDDQMDGLAAGLASIG